jgi:hypothetical protein
MPIYYDSKKIIPAPKVSVRKVNQKAANGETIGTVYSITVTGKFLSDKGSPTSSGTFWNSAGYPPDETISSDSQMTALINKMASVRGLFATEGRVFEIVPWDGAPSTTCNPRVIDIDTPSSDPISWYNVADYVVNLECDSLYGPLFPDGEDNLLYKVSEVEETWQFELVEQPQNLEFQSMYRLSHTAGATGKRFYLPDGTLEKEPWEQAKDWVLARVGFDVDKIESSGFMNTQGTYYGFNHIRSENTDKFGGKYSISENWLVAQDGAIEDFSVETVNSIEDGLVRVNIQGTVTGIESRDSDYQITKTKWESASGYFDGVVSNLLSRAQSYSNVTLNIEPTDRTIGRNPVTGVITYNYSYNDRPSNCIAGAKSEIITVTDDLPTDVFAIIPILARAEGPLLQDINTITESRRTINIECIMPKSNGCTPGDWNSGKPDVNALISGVIPTASSVFVSQNQEVWVPKRGAYNRTVQWTYGN